MIAGEDFVSQIKRSTIQSQISQSSQIKIISQLNVKAHVQASQKEPETVVKEITRQAKIDDLITHLISSWLWKKNVYKLVKKCLESDSIRHYFLMYHEASVINLLELVLFDKKACNFEYVIDVIDYIYDKIVFLNENNETSDEFQVIEQRIAFSSLSVLRYITDSISSESLFTTRLLFDYDFIILLVNLIETAPWLKRSIKNNTKIIEKFDQNEWKQVIGDDINVICKIEAQVIIGNIGLAYIVQFIP